MNPRLIKARCIATGIQSPLEATRLLWSGSAEGGSQVAWATLTSGLEMLTATQVQQRFAAEGIEITLNAATELQAEAVSQRPSGVLPVIGLDDEHAVAAVDMRDGAGLHSASLSVIGLDIVAQGGAA